MLTRLYRHSVFCPECPATAADRSAHVASSRRRTGCLSSGDGRPIGRIARPSHSGAAIAKTAVYISFRCISRLAETAPAPHAARPRRARRQATGTNETACDPRPDQTRPDETRRDERRRDPGPARDERRRPVGSGAPDHTGRQDIGQWVWLWLDFRGMSLYLQPVLGSGMWNYLYTCEVHWMEYNVQMLMLLASTEVRAYFLLCLLGRGGSPM